MKQIIVNVDGLTIEEKKRVSEALAKIKNINMCNPLYWDVVVLLYGPSSDGVNVGFGYYEAAKPTHAPQQVLAMAGMTEMTTKRKVRKDFDPTKEYSVDVSKCTEEEKKEVQQAFFDAGILWRIGGKKYQFFYAEQYSNTLERGEVTKYCMHGDTTDGCNMTAKEFLDLVYEPEQRGHAHAELMAQYAEDAKTHAEPWKLWQLQCTGDEWQELANNPTWVSDLKYRRKPKTHIVHGVEIPDLRVTPKVGEEFYIANVGLPELFQSGRRTTEDCTFTQRMLERGLIYPLTEEGKQAAILHAKAMLGMVQE